MPFDPSAPVDEVIVPDAAPEFDPSQPYELDASTAPNQKEMAEAMADSAAELMSATSNLPRPISRLLLRAGGKKTDIAIGTILPISGSAIGTLAAPGPGTIAGGAAGGVTGEALVEMRQILRGEREGFSPGSLIGTGVVSAVVPKPIQAAGGTVIREVGKAVGQRAIEGGVLGAAQEAIRGLIDDGEITLGNIAENALWGSLFGGAFGTLEKGAPALWNTLKSKPPKEAVPILREDGSPQALALADEIDAKMKSGDIEIISVDEPPPLTARPAATAEPSVQTFVPLEEATRELAKTPPEKVESLRKTLERPDIDFQYSVWDADMVPPGRDRTMQIDIIPTNPNEPTMGGLGSTNRQALAALGVDLPPAPDWLPPGSYSRAEIAKAIADGPPQLAEVGLGAASPKEFQPVQKFTTSLKNDVVDQERVARGEPPIMAVAKKDLGSAWDEGMAKIDENQNVPDELIAELKEGPRPVKDFETAILLQRKIDLQNEFNKANRNIEQGIGTPDSLASDRATKQRVLDELLDLDSVARTTGTESGRALNARKLIAAEDFSLTSMLTKRRVAQGDTPLTPEQTAQVESLHKKIVETEAEFESLPPGFEKNKAQARADKAKHDFNDALDKDRFDRLSGTRKLLEQAGNTYDAAKNIMTTGELSFIGRQGLIQGLSHPIRTAKALPRTFKALFADPVTARAIDLDTLNDPRAPLARESGVHLDDTTTKLAKKEEIVMSRWGDKTPIVRNFNQAGRVFLNKVRLDSFKALADMDPRFSPQELESLAAYVNQSTGRGSLGTWGERNAVALSRTLFSPRFLTSRFQYIAGNSLWGGTAATRKLLAKEYARTLIGLGTMYSLYEFGFAGDDKDGYQPVNFDPRSAMFGKMKIGNTTIDPLAGLSQAVVFSARTGLTAADAAGIETGPQYMTNKGNLVDLREPKFGQDDWGDVATRFARSKLHPIPGTVLNLMKGRDVAGQPVSLSSEAVNFVSPMTYPDIYEALKEQDIDDGTAITLLALLGAGVNTYQEKEARAKALKQPTKVTVPVAP